MAATVAAGILVFLKIPALDTVTRASYTVFDAAITVVFVAAFVTVFRGIAVQFRGNADAPKPIPRPASELGMKPKQP